ncbi:hypothetical protein C8Q77DRAFT_689025 [Trametes polyzona]|nr:hypothetical protein C8Q77DRAFT_689025 [Trametes polyzona]
MALVRSWWALTKRAQHGIVRVCYMGTSRATHMRLAKQIELMTTLCTAGYGAMTRMEGSLRECCCAQTKALYNKGSCAVTERAVVGTYARVSG